MQKIGKAISKIKSIGSLKITGLVKYDDHDRIHPTWTILPVRLQPFGEAAQSAIYEPPHGKTNNLHMRKRYVDNSDVG